MKKKFLSIIIMISLLTGCFQNKDNLKNFIKKYKNLKNYYLTGTLEIVNNEDTYTYDVKVSYKDKDLYKVDLKNKTNNHEQIVLKNSSGVYVITPSLNKSFKFQSDWPYNNSQSYLLQSIINDIENDNNKKIKNNKDETIITTKVNYKNNPKLKKQKIYLKDSIIDKVEVYDNDSAKIKMKFNEIDLKPKFDKKYFEVKNNYTKVIKTATQLDDIIYPMNIPKNTYLSSENKINLSNGERVILTFSGDKPFTLVEETINVDKELETINTMGEPELFIDTIGSIDSNSLSWMSRDVSYYATSDSMNEQELLSVVKSMNTIPVSK